MFLFNNKYYFHIDSHLTLILIVIYFIKFHCIFECFSLDFDMVFFSYFVNTEHERCINRFSSMQKEGKFPNFILKSRYNFSPIYSNITKNYFLLHRDFVIIKIFISFLRVSNPIKEWFTLNWFEWDSKKRERHHRSSSFSWWMCATLNSYANW